MSVLRDRLFAAYLSEMRTSEPEVVRRSYADAYASLTLKVLDESAGDEVARAFYITAGNHSAETQAMLTERWDSGTLPVATADSWRVAARALLDVLTGSEP